MSTNPRRWSRSPGSDGAISSRASGEAPSPRRASAPRARPGNIFSAWLCCPTTSKMLSRNSGARARISKPTPGRSGRAQLAHGGDDGRAESEPGTAPKLALLPRFDRKSQSRERSSSCPSCPRLAIALASRHLGATHRDRHVARSQVRPVPPFARGAPSLLVLHRARGVRPGRGHRLYRLVVHRHGRQLGQALAAAESIAGRLSPVPCAGLWRRHRNRRPDAARIPHRQHHRPFAGEFRRGDARSHAGGAGRL